MSKKNLNLYSRGCTSIMNTVKVELESMKDGDVLTIKTDNRCAFNKIKNLCYALNCDLKMAKVDDLSMRFIIKKREAQ